MDIEQRLCCWFDKYCVVSRSNRDETITGRVPVPACCGSKWLLVASSLHRSRSRQGKAEGPPLGNDAEGCSHLSGIAGRGSCRVESSQY